MRGSWRHLKNDVLSNSSRSSRSRTTPNRVFQSGELPPSMETIPAFLRYEEANSKNRDIPIHVVVGCRSGGPFYRISPDISLISNIEGIKQHLAVYNKCSTTPSTGGTPNPTDKPSGRESALHVLLVVRVRYAVMESGLDAGLVCAAGRAAFMKMKRLSMVRGESIEHDGCCWAHWN